MKGWSKNVVLFVLAAIFLLSCNPKEEKIKIGAILPLTGPAAIFGKSIQNGINLYLENHKNNIGLTLYFEDSEAQPAKAISAIQKLIGQGVQIFIGGVTSSTAIALLPVIEKNKVILVSPSASSPKLSNNKGYFFRVELSEDKGAEKQAELAISKLGWKKISVLYINNDYGVAAKNAFMTEFEKLGGEIMISESFSAGNRDFRTLLYKINNDSSEAVFLVAQNEYVQIINQMRELGFTKNIYATPVFENQTFLEEIGKKNAENIIYAYYGDFDITSKDSAKPSVDFWEF